MRTHSLVFGLFLFSCVVFVGAKASAQVEEKEFHDPFASDSEPTKPQVKVSDPLERMNRAFFAFNDRLYRWVLRPVSKGYRTVAPTPVRESVDRLFTNAKYPVRGVNNLLEGRFGSAGIETARFVVNSTVGVAGLFDPAAHLKLKPRPADFDQTLALYGLPTGIYFNWPVFGPSSVRGTFGTTGDVMLSPFRYVDAPWVGIGATSFDMVNATSLHIEEYDGLRSATLDPYAALRSAYFEKHGKSTGNPAAP